MELKTEVERFKKWAASEPQDCGEWETDYPEWPALRAAAQEALMMPTLDDNDANLLLFALARDNECEFILGMLEDAPVNGLRLARAAVKYPDADARWQAAVYLGTRPEAEAIDLLRQFVGDKDEYVRRIALLAMPRHDPEFAAATARQWLDSPHNYSRLAALTVLNELNSSHLREALERLRADPFEYVRKKVADLEKQV